MPLSTYFNLFLLTITFAFGSHIAYKYIIAASTKKKVQKEIHEVIMFSYNDRGLKRSKYSRCSITQSMERLLYYLNTPKYTMDICMYVLTNLDLTNAVMKMRLKGVKIRIIVDADMAYSSGSNIRKLEKHGIPVRWMKSTNLMHHKFILIDASSEQEFATPLVMMGSLNWTNQALNGNWEDVAVTSQQELVRQYKEEFEKLWVAFKPIVD
ncbi:uncharacterized protein LOC106129339 [Amyelois transitella]|uniref:uncharacterized protein LOC106129339 n=1 Tax=Amyelois transitella TaxID=680683 RepID=UPI00067C6903|nr:uncharacterized protein LOC106129339 [Amyelois transitella]